MKTYVYVTTTELEWPGPIQSSGAPSGIKVFELDDSGTLELLHQYDMPGKGPAPLVITPDKKFIFASSMAVYANSHLPKQISETYLVDPISPYGTSKLACEHYSRVICDINNIDCIILRYFNT